MRKSLCLLIVCCIIAAFLSSCEKETKVSGLIVEPKNLILSEDDVVPLLHAITPYRADNKAINWTSKDISIVTVSETGVIKAISAGKTQIIAVTSDGNFTDTVAVTVLRGSRAGDRIALLKI